MTRTHLNETVYEALFASPLQPSDTLTNDNVAVAIGSTIRRLGAAGCTGCVAEEFGNHPEESADRMQWVRQMASDMCERLYFPTAAPTATSSAGTDMLPVCAAA
ncbi:MAG TPA: hypothetical protein VGI58_11360 [Streptosporangiaceae bacterium]